MHHQDVCFSLLCVYLITKCMSHLLLSLSAGMWKYRQAQDWDGQQTRGENPAACSRHEGDGAEVNRPSSISCHRYCHVCHCHLWHFVVCHFNFLYWKFCHFVVCHFVVCHFNFLHWKFCHFVVWHFNFNYYHLVVCQLDVCLHFVPDC